MASAATVSPAAREGAPKVAAAVPGRLTTTAEGERLTALAHVRTIGRFAPDRDGLRFAWSGSTIAVRFEGTALRVRLRDEGKQGMNAFQVVVDGEPRKVLRTSKERDVYDVVTDLPGGAHDVVIEKRTEARVGEVVLLGVETDGKLLAEAQSGPGGPSASRPRPRRIEILGDSISTGYGNEGPGPLCTFDAREQNEFLTYGAVTARALGAEHTTIAWSGKTLYEMRQLFSRALPEREDSAWDTSRFQPDLVVLNLGTNNFANIDPGEKKFVELYVALVARVREAYPAALVVAALGPMLTDTYPEGRRSLTQARKYMKAAVAKIQAAGDRNVEMLEFPEQKVADGLGCGFHPSVKTHKVMAERLTAFVRERLGW
jgi:lysophospholipase L1-like esterase